MKVLILVNGPLDTSPFNESRDFLHTNGLDCEFEFVTLPAATYPLVNYGGDAMCVDYNRIEQLAAGYDNKFNFLFFDPKPYGTKILSSAKVGAAGARQYGQIVSPTVYSEPVHELCHLFYNFLGLPDKVHEIIKEERSDADKAFGGKKKAFGRIVRELTPLLAQIVSELGPLLPQETMKMSPRFLLRRRIPIYKAGFNSLRTSPITGARFVHEAQDYRASYEPVYMPEDGTVTNKWSALGGYGQLIETKEYTFTIWHLSKRLKTGNVLKGDQIAATGNSGMLTSGPHMHLEAVYRITNNKIDPEGIRWDEERANDMLIKKQGSPEFSYLSSKKVRHPMSERAWVEYFDSAAPDVEATVESYNNFLTGKAIFFTANFGATEVPENVWEAEPAE